MDSEKNQADSETLEFVSLAAAGQEYCIDITRIREIRRMASVTPLPHSEEHVLGVMNLRGTVIPIYDLSAKLGMGSTSESSRNVVIVVAYEKRVVGILVESVSEIVSIDVDEIRPNPTLKKGGSDGRVDGLISMGERMLRVLNLDSLLSDLSIELS